MVLIVCNYVLLNIGYEQAGFYFEKPASDLSYCRCSLNVYTQVHAIKTYAPIAR